MTLGSGVLVSELSAGKWLKSIPYILPISVLAYRVDSSVTITSCYGLLLHLRVYDVLGQSRLRARITRVTISSPRVLATPPRSSRYETRVHMLVAK